MVNIEVIGLNHRTAPINLREKLSFSASILPQALSSLKERPGIKEGVILSTCNRVEIYALGAESKELKAELADFLSSFHEVDNTDLSNYFYSLKGIPAVRHLLCVSSSLDSQVMGENQILGQVKDAYLRAKQSGAASNVLSFIFEEAIKIGKRARYETQIGFGAVSISAAAVEMAKKIFEDFSKKKVLIIGAGKIGELSARYLYDRGAEMVLVANRTFSKAQKLAEQFKGKAVQFDSFSEVLTQVDVVISSVNAPALLVTKDIALEVMKKRKQRPIFFIDLGLPRNIDPEINTIENMYVYNLDDLKMIKDANLEERLKEAKKVEKIIDEELIKIESRLGKLSLNEK